MLNPAVARKQGEAEREIADGAIADPCAEVGDAILLVELKAARAPELVLEIDVAAELAVVGLVGGDGDLFFL